MQTEIEVKFLDIDPTKLRSQLRHLGAHLINPERLMRRVNFESPGLLAKSAWVRVRDEGTQITMTYKQTVDATVTGTKEINLTVDSYSAAVAFLGAIELEEKSAQETRRESWRLGEVQIEIDTWPWLKPFVELEGPAESDLQDLAQKLGLSWQDHLAGDVTAVYQRSYTFVTEDLYHHPLIFGPRPNWIQPK